MRKQLGVTVTVNDLKEVMKEHYKLLNCEENDEEVTLHVNDSEKKKSNNRNNRHRQKKFNGPYNNCGMNGHKMRDCQALERNASKHSNWYRN